MHQAFVPIRDRRKEEMGETRDVIPLCFPPMKGIVESLLEI